MPCLNDQAAQAFAWTGLSRLDWSEPSGMAMAYTAAGPVESTSFDVT